MWRGGGMRTLRMRQTCQGQGRGGRLGRAGMRGLLTRSVAVRDFVLSRTDVGAVLLGRFTSSPPRSAAGLSPLSRRLYSAAGCHGRRVQTGAGPFWGSTPCCCPLYYSRGSEVVLR